MFHDPTGGRFPFNPKRAAFSPLSMSIGNEHR
jgi:hypothetical protein